MKFLSAAALLLLLQAQDTYLLHWGYKKGDKVTRSITSKVEVKGKRTVQGNPEDQERQLTEAKRYRDEVLDVAGPEASQLKRKILEWWEEVKKPTDAKPVRSAKTLQGKTILIKRKGEESDITGVPDAPPEELKQNRLRHDVFLLSLPKKPVAVGTEWPIDEKAFAADLRDTIKGYDPTTCKATGRFDKVEAYAGVQCAVLIFTSETEGTWKGWSVSKYAHKMQINGWLSLDKGRWLAVRSEGSTTFSADNTIGTSRTVMETSTIISAGSENVFE